MEELLPLFTHIINLSIATGEFPHEWKTALVVSLLKKEGLNPILKICRPVSNLQYVSKLKEQAVLNHSTIYTHTVDFLCHLVSLFIEQDILQKPL